MVGVGARDHRVELVVGDAARRVAIRRVGVGRRAERRAELDPRDGARAVRVDLPKQLLVHFRARARAAASLAVVAELGLGLRAAVVAGLVELGLVELERLLECDLAATRGVGGVSRKDDEERPPRSASVTLLLTDRRSGYGTPTPLRMGARKRRRKRERESEPENTDERPLKDDYLAAEERAEPRGGLLAALEPRRALEVLGEPARRRAARRVRQLLPQW